jgi:hypothetical protein
MSLKLPNKEEKTMKKSLKNPTPYLKMRVLGAIDTAPGKTIRERVKNVAQNKFTDEEGNDRQFTWRTISTWLYRYKKHGVTAVDNKIRADKGKTRKISPEELLEAINQVLPYFRKKHYNKRDLYRKCLEMGCQRQLFFPLTTIIFTHLHMA